MIPSRGAIPCQDALFIAACVEERRCGDHRQRPGQSIAGFFQFCTVLDTAATIIPGDISRTSLCGKVCSWTMHSVEIKHLISFRARVAIMRPLEFLLCKTSTVHALIRCQFVAKKNQKTKKRNIKKETHTGAKEKSIQESEDLKRSE